MVGLEEEGEDLGKFKVESGKFKIMVFKGIQKTSLIEYPGKIATVVFVGGCNFRCLICHNRDMVLFPQKLADIPETEVLEHLNKRKGMVEAVVISGGEPTLYPELPEFIKKVKALDYLVEVETNGTNPEMIKELIEQKLIDYWAMDIKGPLSEPDLYAKISGITDLDLINKVKQSVELIKNSGVAYEFRTTYVPDLLTEADFDKIGQDLKGAKRYVIQGFRPVNNLDESFNAKLNWPPATFEKIKNDLSKYFGEIAIRN